MTKELKIGIFVWVLLGFYFGVGGAGIALALVLLPWWMLTLYTLVGMVLVGIWNWPIKEKK